MYVQILGCTYASSAIAACLSSRSPFQTDAAKVSLLLCVFNCFFIDLRPTALLHLSSPTAARILLLLHSLLRLLITSFLLFYFYLFVYLIYSTFLPSFHFISSHLISSHLISSHLISTIPFTSSHLNYSFHLISSQLFLLSI